MRLLRLPLLSARRPFSTRRVLSSAAAALLAGCAPDGPTAPAPGAMSGVFTPPATVAGAIVEIQPAGQVDSVTAPLADGQHVVARHGGDRLLLVRVDSAVTSLGQQVVFNVFPKPGIDATRLTARIVSMVSAAGDSIPVTGTMIFLRTR
jgi:hypothetical protein